MAEEKNPYANLDGSPKSGQLPEFFEWARAKEMKRRESLPKEERERLERADKHMADKMNS